MARSRLVGWPFGVAMLSSLLTLSSEGELGWDLGFGDSSSF